jgi:hypothetical protein
LRARSLFGLILLAIPFAAMPVAADCTVISPSASPDINYTTVCALDEGGFTDGTQTFDHDYLAHVSHAVEVDPVFDYAYADVDQESWVYDDGEVRQERETTHVGAGAFEGVRGLAGGGFFANMHQRDQTSVEDGDGACSGIVGRSTCVAIGGWFTVQDVGGVGAGVYYQQAGTGDACAERAEVDADLVLVFVPVVEDLGGCEAEAPYFYDEASFDALLP